MKTPSQFITRRIGSEVRKNFPYGFTESEITNLMIGYAEYYHTEKIKQIGAYQPVIDNTTKPPKKDSVDIKNNCSLFVERHDSLPKTICARCGQDKFLHKTIA